MEICSLNLDLLVEHTLKDLTYIHEMLKDLGNSEKLADLEKSFYKKAVDEGNGDLFISELIKKD